MTAPDPPGGKAPGNGEMASTPDPSSGAVAASHSPSLSPAQARRPYTPQFSMTTQMLLNRIRTESSASPSTAIAGSSPVLTSSAVKLDLNSTAYQDARRRVVAGMTTTAGMTMAMPMPPPAPARPAPSAPTRPASKAAGMSAIRRVTEGIPSKHRAKAAADPKPTPGAAPASKKPKAPTLIRITSSGTKRKRRADADAASDDDDDGSPPSSGAEDHILTTTKSGRHVLKPVAYNPAAMESARRPIANRGKRTPGEAMCKRCSRLVSPDANPIVFCDGCEGAWHQMCHDPPIEAAVVGDPNAKWFCAACVAKRPPAHKKAKVEAVPAVRVKTGWMGRTAGQKRAYLSSLAQGELISLLIQASELHPDLPIFPSEDGPTPATAQIDSSPFGPINYIRKISSNGSVKKDGPATNGAPEFVPGTTLDPDEEDPKGLMEAWPKPGHGLYAKLSLEWGDETLVDKDDYEAFSHIIYDDKGRKLIENGVSVGR